MAYTVEILEDHDILTPDLYIRPTSDYVGMFERRADYYKWKPIGEVLGEIWFKYSNIKVGDLIRPGKISLHYEFMRKLSKHE